MTLNKNVLAGMVATCAIGVVCTAQAVDVEFVNHQNATAVCQSALPAFDGLIRKRPLAVQNEGTGTAFVTCSFIGNNATTRRLSLYFINNSAAAQNVSCTMVDGFDTGSTNFGTKSVSVVANRANQANIAWDAATDNANVNYSDLVNVSCQLPPGTGINDTYNYYPQDVGA